MGTREGGRRPEGGNTKPGFIPLGGCPQTQHLSRLTVSISTMTLRRKENVETLPATSQKTRSPWLSRLAAAHKPSIYPAWRPLTNPVFIPLGAAANPAFIPLGGCPRTQHLPRLVAAHKLCVYPAWQSPANPVFIPLGGCLRIQRLSRLVAFCVLKKARLRGLFS